MDLSHSRSHRRPDDRREDTFCFSYRIGCAPEVGPTVYSALQAVPDHAIAVTTDCDERARPASGIDRYRGDFRRPSRVHWARRFSMEERLRATFSEISPY